MKSDDDKSDKKSDRSDRKKKSGASNRKKKSTPSNKRRSVKTDRPSPPGNKRPGKEPKKRSADKPKRPKNRGGHIRGEKSGRARGSMKNPATADQKPQAEEEMRINKFIAHSGLCSRRDADKYVSAGRVKVNGKVVSELGSKVKKTDEVVVDGQKLSLEPFVYLLLNKKSGTITTTDDEKDRQTVMQTIEDATGYRVYPVGRLDRSTMGLLVLTNDGDLAHRLMHPSYEVKKTYLITPNRTLTDEEVTRLREGVELEDGFIKPEKVTRDPLNPDKVIITVKEGRNHLIRRMVDYIGADVDRLERIKYAGLSDKDLSIGRWRYLRQNEVNRLRRTVKLDTLDFNKESS